MDRISIDLDRRIGDIDKNGADGQPGTAREELYARTAGPTALDAQWSSDTYSARHIPSNFVARESAMEYLGVRKLSRHRR